MFSVAAKNSAIGSVLLLSILCLHVALNEGATYRLWFVTAKGVPCADSSDGGGTNAEIVVTIVGETGNLSITLVTDPGYEQGNTNDASVDGDISQIMSISIKNNGGGNLPNWFVEKIVVEDPYGKRSTSGACVIAEVDAMSFLLPKRELLMKIRSPGEATGVQEVSIQESNCHTMRAGFAIEIDRQVPFNGGKFVEVKGHQLHCGSQSEIGILSLRLRETKSIRRMSLCNLLAGDAHSHSVCQFDCHCRSGSCQYFDLIGFHVDNTNTHLQVCSVKVSDG